MSDNEYTPPKVWKWEADNGGTWASTNRPIAGATSEKVLPVGKHPLQLYSMATPNGVKATVMLEELLALGHSGAEYDAHLIKIGDGDQFGSGFVDVNPNSKIPALMDHSAATPTRVFESGAILLYLAEKFGALLPSDASLRAECLSWLFWQMGSAPYLGLGRQYDAAEFLDVASYKHVIRWAKQIDARDAVKRGRMVNRFCLTLNA